MTDLLDLIIDRLGVLLTGTTWPDPEGGELAARLYKSVLPAKRSAGAGEDFPFVLARIMGGSEAQAEGLITVRIIGGLYSATDEEAGNDDIQELADLLLQMADTRSYTPYKLALPVDWWLGDKEHGVQPHPEYYVTVDLRFKRAPTAKNRR